MTDHICVGLFLGLCILFHLSMDLFMLILYHFDCYIFVLQFKIRKCDASNFVLLSQDCFGDSGFFVFHTSLRIVFSISVNAFGIL